MFTEVIDALARFIGEASGVPVRVVPWGAQAGAGTAGAATRGSAAAAGGAHAPAAGTEDAAPAPSPSAVGVAEPPSAAIALQIAAITRSERMGVSDREVRRTGNGTSVRPGAGWYDLSIALVPEGDGAAAAEALERVLLASMKAGNLGVALSIESAYPVHATLDAPDSDELARFWRPALGGTATAMLTCRLTVALQPFEPAPSEVVRTRRIHVEDKRTTVRETVER